MGGADRQHATGRGLRGDHAKSLGEDARNDQRLAQRKHVVELVVFEATREDRTLAQRRRPGLEALGVRAEADHHKQSVRAALQDQRPSIDQELHALGHD